MNYFFDKLARDGYSKDIGRQLLMSVKSPLFGMGITLAADQAKILKEVLSNGGKKGIDIMGTFISRYVKA